jgi:hypothetical protein
MYLHYVILGRPETRNVLGSRSLDDPHNDDNERRRRRMMTKTGDLIKL